MKRKSILKDLKIETGEKSSNNITRCFDFEVITPMIGGDADSWILNKDAPVRSASVKGNLRYWWRTMQSEKNSHKLLEIENVIWGGSVKNDSSSDVKGKKGKEKEDKNKKIKSPVSLFVDKQNVEQVKQVFYCRNGKYYSDSEQIIPNNVIFPVDSCKKNFIRDGIIEDVTIIEKMTFRLNITFPEAVERDVMNSIKLWTLFGGVGARTRRGTGSLYCKEIMNEFPSMEAIHKFIETVNVDVQDEFDYPRMDKSLLFVKEIRTGDCAEEWHKMLSDYGDYRQDRFYKDNGNPGRTYWPEADAIRRITGEHSVHHEPEHPDGIWFPRAAFGLPILTKFHRDNYGDPGVKEKKNSVIQLKPNGDKRNRLPSPVIIKVIKLSDSQVVKIALVMSQKFPESLVLTGKEKNLPKTIKGKNLPFTEDQNEKRIMRASSPLKRDKNMSLREAIYSDMADFLGLGRIQ